MTIPKRGICCLLECISHLVVYGVKAGVVPRIIEMAPIW